MAVELAMQIERDLGVRLTLSQFLKGPTVMDVAAWLGDQPKETARGATSTSESSTGNAKTANPSPHPEAGPGDVGLGSEPTDELEGLSESELDRLLAETLSRRDSPA